MPYIPHTPEALIPRSDSRNPATTCKGITSNGRACRRSLAASPRSSPNPSPSNAGSGVLAVLSDTKGNEEGAAAFFCWQHKDQAAALAEGKGNRTDVFQLKERTSIDTLAERLGVLEVDDRKKKQRRKQKKGSEQGVIRRDTMPQQWQQINGPLMSIPEGSIPLPSRPSRQHEHPRRPVRQELHLSFFCCMRQPEKDDIPPIRVRPEQSAQSKQTEKPVSRPSVAEVRPLTTSYPKQTSSYTQALLSFIPTGLPAATNSLLLTELSKPLSASDREAGYIYIFWLAPPDSPHTSASNAYSSPSLPPNMSEPGRTSDVLHASNTLRAWTGGKDFQNKTSSSTSPQRSPIALNENKTIMLKIGRASNVQRRMNEWTRQCGHPLSLVRYYPHHRQHQSSPSPSISTSPSPFRLSPTTSPAAPLSRPISPGQKVPLVARVERLIHVELGAKRVKKNCEGCGKEHREWFEVEATRKGVKGVDEVVRRWVEWAEREN